MIRKTILAVVAAALAMPALAAQEAHLACNPGSPAELRARAEAAIQTAREMQLK